MAYSFCVLNCTIIYDITFERSHTSTINFRLVIQNTILSIKIDQSHSAKLVNLSIVIDELTYFMFHLLDNTLEIDGIKN